MTGLSKMFHLSWATENESEIETTKQLGDCKHLWSRKGKLKAIILYKLVKSIPVFTHPPSSIYIARVLNFHFFHGKQFISWLDFQLWFYIYKATLY